MKTLLLNPQTWDLTKDASGNIATATNPYSLAQDAASAIKTFLTEVWYDTTQGVPYFEEILGRQANIALIKAKLEAAALASSPEIVATQVFITSIVSRNVRGQVQVTDEAGVITAAAF